MEATVLSVGKSVVDGALGYAKSGLAEEVALQLGVQRDQAFIRDELEMMQSFLMAAHDERHEHEVIKTWVKQVRDVAYDVEDCLQDFAVRLEKQSWWRNPRTLRDRRRVAKQMKDLRAKVEDVSQRNVRYRIFQGSSGSKPTNAADQSSSSASATMFGIDEARRAAKQDKPKVDLVQLINKEDKDLRVIAVWGTSGDLGQTSIIKRAYDDLKICEKFECRAWIRLMHPFDPTEFMQSILRQFYANSFLEAGNIQEKATLRAQVLKDMGMIKQEDLIDKFIDHVVKKSFLIVLNGLLTIEDWDSIKMYFLNTKNGSRIVVSTEKVEVASLCAGQESQVSELKQLSADQTLYVFCEKDSQDGMDSTKAPGKSLTRIEMTVAACSESELVGRVKEKTEIIALISKDSQQVEVISVWGMGGLGKTTLVKDIYQSQELNGKFEKRACVTVMRPFSRLELLRSLVMQLGADTSEKDVLSMLGSTKKTSPLNMGLEDLIKELSKLLEEKRCLVVLDDLSTTAEWDLIIPSSPEMKNTSRIIVTTREENIAKHCSKKQENIYKLEGLQYEDAVYLFTKKVFKETGHLVEQYPELVEEAELILNWCNGLPLAVLTVGGFLAKQPKTAVEWRKFNKHMSAELKMNPGLQTIRAVLDKSYDGLPYLLKSCLLYLSIFPEDHKVRRRRLVRRWAAEGYSREIRNKSAEEVADNYFMELIQRSMILPSQQSIHSKKGVASCQVHDLIREISISKSMEENLVFTLEEGCSLNSQGTVLHLAISSSWEGDQIDFESTVDMSQIRSLTVFGKCRSFFISEKMRFLRVLDLENASGLVDHHLEQIGKLLHLNYLSLRGCSDICYLPNSLGNLRQIQTLDIRDTQIIKLPKSIINLRKLQCLCAGYISVDEDGFYEEIVGGMPKLLRNKPCLLTLSQMVLCVACFAPKLFEGYSDDGGHTNRRDVCNYFCCFIFPIIAKHLDPYGVIVPRGICKLKALHTLSVVNIARGKPILQEIKRLTRLRKLGVTGVNKKNGKEFCSAIADLSHLESLSVRSEGEPGLSGCLDGLSSPPENLQSLKLYGNLVKLPEWIQRLKNLVKLKLRSTRLLGLDAALQVLGNLPKLAILRLCNKSFKGDELRFNLHPEAFPGLMVLQLDGFEDLKSVEFKQGATPKLELLQVVRCWHIDKIGISGLSFLPSLKQVQLDDYYETDFVEDVRTQLADNPNRPVLKIAY